MEKRLADVLFGEFVSATVNGSFRDVLQQVTHSSALLKGVTGNDPLHELPPLVTDQIVRLNGLGKQGNMSKDEILGSRILTQREGESTNANLAHKRRFNWSTANTRFGIPAVKEQFRRPAESVWQLANRLQQCSFDVNNKEFTS